MRASANPTPRRVLLGLAAFLLFLVLISAALYGLSGLLMGPFGSGAGGVVGGLIVALISKAFEHQKQLDWSIAEKKRDVYRRLLAPYQQLLANIKATKDGDDLLAGLDLGAMYGSAFDAVLYGSENVVEKYAEFRSPSTPRDAIDMLKNFATVLIAIREDVTGKKSNLPEETVLSTFVNLTDEQRLLLRLRRQAETPAGQALLKKAMAGSEATKKAASP